VAIKQVVLVAGFDYELSGADFASIAKNRMARLIKKHPKDKLVFTLFDVGTGDVSKNGIKDPKKPDTMKNRKWSSISSFTAVGTSNYTSPVAGHENQFDSSTAAGIMSITDVFTFIQGIGAGPDAGSVLELSFFCHGWFGGPVLVNSFDPHRDDPSTPRDPNDKDARTVKDFIPPTTSSGALANLVAAFSPTAIAWIFGCSFSKARHIILSAIYKTPVFKKRPKGTIKDTDVFKFEFVENVSEPSIFDTIMSILSGGILKAGPPRSYKVDSTLADVKTALRSGLDNTYSAALAKNGHVDTFGALPGTYADYEKIPRRKLPLMIIPQKKPPYADNFSRHIEFYKTYLKINIDPEERGYGLFKRP
jgi:hypothetical protein